MERIITLITAALLLFFNPTGVASQECPESLVHYWNLEEDDNGFEDVVGGLNVQVENGTTKVLGVVNSAQYFNGLSELNIPAHETFNWDANDNFTIEYWINKTSGCPQPQVQYNNVVIGRDDPSSSLHWWTGVSCVNQGKVDITMIANNGNGYSLQSNTTVINGSWHHVAIVRNGSTNVTAIYVDGILDNQITHEHTGNFASDSPVNIGWLNLDSKYHLDASVDELAIYSSAIDESTIVDHYNSGSGRDYCTGLVTAIPEIPRENTDFNVFPNVIITDFRVSFTLNEDQPVALTLLDITGREIATLLNQKLQSGNHTYNFSVGSAARFSVALIRMQLKNTVVTKKVLIQ